MVGFGSELGTSTSPSMGTFKVANNLGKLPAGGATMKGVAGLEGRAENVSLKHSTVGSGQVWTFRWRRSRPEQKWKLSRLAEEGQ